MSLTSFESFFGNVFKSSPKKQSQRKTNRRDAPLKPQPNAHPSSSPTATRDPDHHHNNNETELSSSNAPLKSASNVSEFEHSANQTRNHNDTKISNIKLQQSKKYRQNSINRKKSELQSNLSSFGIEAKKMSMSKQRKLLHKAMQKNSEEKQQKNKSEPEVANKLSCAENADSLSFLQEMDLFPEKKSEQKKTKTKNKKNSQQAKTPKTIDKTMKMDLDFGDVIKPDFQKHFDEERFVRTGKSNKKISDRHLLKELKQRHKFVEKRFGNRANFMDEHMADNLKQKMQGRKVKTDLKFLKKKLKQKHKQKVKSQREWKARTKRKEFGRTKRMQRRNENIASYQQGKISKRIGPRITAQQAIAEASNM